MKYGIFCPFLKEPNSIEISEQEFVRAKLATKNLTQVLSIEGKFDMVLENYVEYERELLELALQEMVRQGRPWSAIQFDIYRVNRRLANLLSATRLYTDQIKHDVSSLEDLGNSLAEKLEQYFSAEYDSRFGYRVMVELRNYAQHRSLPVHGLSYGRSWEPREDPTNLVFRMAPSVRTSELREDGHFNAATLADLATLGEHIPLTPLVREYIEGLSAVHENFRKMADKIVNEWETTLRQVQDRAAKEFGVRKNLLLLTLVDDEGHRSDEGAVIQGALDHRKELVQKNTGFAKLSARFVSGACGLRNA